MSTLVMTERIPEISPRLRARAAGVCWLITIVTGALALSAEGRMLVTVNAMATVSYLAATLLVYQLLKPVNARLSLIAALFSVAGCATASGSMFLGLPSPIDPLTLFGMHCLLSGYLIYQSTFLPRVVGALLMFGGLGWLTFASPALAQSFAPYNLLPGVIGESSLTLWLIVMGVNVERWSAR